MKPGLLNPLKPCLSPSDDEPFHLQHEGQILPHGCVIFNEQDFGGGHGTESQYGGSESGMRIVKHVPAPSLLSQLISPWCTSTHRLTITRPNPVPGKWLTLLPRWNALNSC